MRRLSSSAREKLYDAECAKSQALGLGDLPICPHCAMPVDGRLQRWDRAHHPDWPRFLGGPIAGIAHTKCNQWHNNKHDTPRAAKTKRTRQRFIGAYRARQPFPGSREHWLRRRMNGTVERR